MKIVRSWGVVTPSFFDRFLTKLQVKTAKIIVRNSVRLSEKSG